MILAVTMILFILVIGADGIRNLTKANKDMSDMYDNRLLAIQYLNDNRNQSRAMEASLYHIFLNIDNKEIVEKNIADIERR